MLDSMIRSPATEYLRSKLVVTILLLFASLALLVACGGNNPAPATQPAPRPTATARSNAAPTQPAQSSNAPIPQACALLTVADVEKISGDSGGTATPLDLGEGSTQCTIITGKGALSVQVNVGAGALPPLPGEKTVDLEGGAKGISSTQTPLNQDWMTKIIFPNFSVLVLATGSAATIDPDKKVADITKADGSKITFGQAYEAFARAIAHNAATGAPAPGGVVQLGDPCTALTLDDVKELLPDFQITGPDYQDTTFGVKQCIYRFRNDAQQALGFVTLAFVTQPKFEADMRQRDPVSGIGDAAGMAAGGTLLDFRKGNTFVYMTFTIGGAGEKIAALQKDGLMTVAEKVAARIQ